MGSSPDSPSGALYAFAVELYASPGVEPLLLALQDEDSLDIPLLIALLYAGRQGVQLSGSRLLALIDLAALWQSKAIGPLRAARRALKLPLGTEPDPDQDALRTKVKAVELEAERLLFARLETCLGRAGSAEPGAAIQKNMEAYLAALARSLSPSGHARLARLASEAAR